MSPLGLLLEGGAPSLRRIGGIVAGFALAWTLLLAACGAGVYAIYLALAMVLVTYAAAGVTVVIVGGVACAAIFWPRKSHEPTAGAGSELFQRLRVPALAAAFAAGFAVSVSPAIRLMIFRELTALAFKSAGLA